MSYLAFALARLAVRGVAPMAGRALENATMDPDKLTRRRAAQAVTPSVIAALGPTWESEKWRVVNASGSLVDDWRAAQALLDEADAKTNPTRIKYRRNVARAYGPTVRALKASRTPAEWEAERTRVRRLVGIQRARNDLPILLAFEDWRVAEYLQPLDLDDDGRLVKGR